MRLVVRTIYGSSLQTSRQLGVPYTIPEFTTINEGLDDAQIIPYQPSSATLGMEYANSYDFANDSRDIKVQYFCIGFGGHRGVNGPVNGITKIDPIPHKTTDSGLYNILPFVIRPIGDDLSVEERRNLRLRKTMLIDGELYVGYFARKLDVEDTSPELKITSVSNGQETTTLFTPSASNMKPTKPSVGVENDGTYAHVSGNIQIEFTQTDVLWFREAIELLYGDPGYAIISEIAICSGVDKLITQRYPQTGVQTSVSVTGETIKEAVGTQPVAFISTFHTTEATSDGVSLGFDLGATEPLYGSEQ